MSTNAEYPAKEIGVPDQVIRPVSSAVKGTMTVLFVDERVDKATVTMTHKKSVTVCVTINGIPYLFPGSADNPPKSVPITGKPNEKIIIKASREVGGNFVEYETHTNATVLPKAIYHFPNAGDTQITIQIEQVSMGLTKD